MLTTWLIVATLAAKPAGSFAALKQDAEELSRPAQAVSTIVGACDENDPELQLRCQENVKGERRKYDGKRYFLDLGAGHNGLLDVDGARADVLRFLWVPMYDAGNGLALTGQEPQKLNAEGGVVLPRKVLDGKRPAGVTASDVKRMAQLGQVNIEVVGKFGKPWALGRADKKVRGVVFKVEAVRLSQARSGETLIETLY